MTQNYLFIASTGKNDLKFLITENGEDKLAEIMGGKREESYLSLRRIHEKLLNNDIPHVFQNVSGIKCKKEKIYFEPSDNGTLTPVLENTNQQVQKTDDNQYILCAAKLQGLIASLKSKAENNEIHIMGALFVGTERVRQFKEPIASHRLLAKHFAELLNMNYAGELPEDGTTVTTACPVYWLNQLKDLPDTDGIHYDGLGLDYPVKRIVAKRIDDSIRQFVDYFKETEVEASPEIIVSDTGGMNDLKDFLSASIRFRAYNDVLESPQTEKSNEFDTNALDRLIEDKHLITRRQSLRVKTLVKSRILEGDIGGAWSACVHIHDETQPVKHDIWTYAIQAVKNYYAGSSDVVLPDSDNLKKYSPVLAGFYTQLKDLLDELAQQVNLDTQIKSTLTRTLFQIESKLQASKPEEQDIIGALRDCSTLADQLLRASVYRYLNTHHNPNNEILNYHSDIIPDSIINTLRESLGGQGLSNYIDSPISKKQIKLRDSSFWRKKLEPIEEYSYFFDFNNRIRSPRNDSDKLSLSLWRNKSTHQSLTAGDIEKIKDIATSNSISDYPYPVWDNNLTSTGTCILNQHYTQQIEKSLGYDIGSTQQKYIDLQNLLLDIINSPIYISD